MPPARQRRPWYGFLYYLLGAQGSFFAWVIALFGVYVTWEEALLFAVNHAPRQSTVAEIFEQQPRWRRWVEVHGVEIDLASKLFAAQGAAAGAPYADRILIDPDDPTAVAWQEIFRQIATVSSRLEGAADGALDAELIRVSQLLARPRSPETREQYRPSRALLVVGREPGDAPAAMLATSTSTSMSASTTPTAVAAPGGLVERWRREMRTEIERIRAAVNIDALRRGFLEPLPQRRRDAYKADYGLAIASSALGIGHRPSQVVAALFGVFAFTLVFLVVGLRAGGPGGGPP